MNGTPTPEQKLLTAAHLGDVIGLRARLADGVSPDTEGGAQGWTALSYAAQGGWGGCVEILLRAGAEPDRADNMGRTALMRAAYEGHTESIGMLLKRGADLEVKDAAGRTALMWAARYGKNDSAKVLLLAGASPLTTTDDGETPGDMARSCGFPSLGFMLDSAREKVALTSVSAEGSPAAARARL